jgi:hypothetical protein
MTPSPSPHREELLRIIREVRARWRWKIALSSVTVLVGAAILTVLAAAYGLEAWRFSPSAIVVFRLVTYLVLVTVGWFFLIRPLARRVTDQQVALYLEEHEPSLEAVLVSAVDATAESQSGQSAASAALLRRLVESAIEQCQRIEFGRNLERRSRRRSLQALGAIAVVAIVTFAAGPAYLRHGALALLLPMRSAEAATPYQIEVAPGDTTVARGADVAITAGLKGFTSAEVDLFTRTSAGAPFERVPLIAGAEAGRFEGTLFALRESTEYFVQSAGVRSPVFRIAVADLPYVERLELEYAFPAYTGLPPQKIESGGDIAVLRGTTVRARVHSTLATRAGRIVRDDGGETRLAANPDGTVGGDFQVTKNGTYRVELESPAGTLVKASPQYTIDVLDDQPPTVSFARPGRDLKPTSIDEVLVDARAEDDFGVRQLDLLYSVNGAAERQLRLAGPGARPLKELSASHTFFLEELGLKPGDVVSYYARATDNDAVQGAKSATSDIYFLQIKAFRKDYRASESQAGAGAQAGGANANANDPSALSDEQRRIIAGTFNVARDRAKVAADKFREDVVFLSLAEGQLRERVETLATQITARVGANETMRTVATSLTEAAKAMRAAEAKLQGRDAKGALPSEQQALAHLQRAEEAYRDVRVMMSEERGGQGGQRSSSASEDLADLFQLELDKLRNQYETFQRGQQQSADNKVDEMLERLRELARRQEQEAERQRQLAGTRQQGAAGGGAASARQRQLADETEEAARRLERLSREENRADLAEAARRMQEAADAMRRAAAAGDARAFAEASAAADRLRQARDRLEQQRSDRMARSIEDARARVEKLAEEEKDIEGSVRGLDQAGARGRQQTTRLMERKDAQAGEVADIERQLDRTASDFRRERQEASRKVQEAADTIRETKLKEKIRYSKGLVQGAPADAAAQFEEQIGADIAALGERLRQAADAAASPERDRRAEALDRARQLLRGMESMDQRLREQRQGQQAGGQAQSGQPGQQGQQGQRGAQAGQRGEQGQQAQQGQPGGQPGSQGRRGRPGEQGQQGAQQGEEGRGGQARGARAPEGADRFSNRPPDAGGGGSARPGLGPEDARQFQREARQRREEAQGLRGDLRALGLDVAELDRLIRELRALDSTRVYSDFDEITGLQAQLVEGFRRFEFDLRRKLGEPGAGQLLLAGPDEAPREYRKQIEEYYRALAREKKKK